MASAAPLSISALPRGHELPRAEFAVSRADAAAYAAAVGDEAPYGDIVPPLAVVALGLAALQAHVTLPEGSLHTGQEVEHSAALRVDTPLTLTGRIAQRSERQGFVVTVLEFEIAPAGAPGLRARATIMAPGGAA